MKILRITSCGYEAGGTETGIALLNDALRAAGHEVKVFSSDAGESSARFSNFECRALSARPFFLQLFYRLWYPGSYFAVRRALQEFQPDIVHVHTLAELSPSVLFALKKYPTVMSVHGAEDFTSGLITWSFAPEFFVDDSFSPRSLNFKGKLHYWYHSYLSRAVYHFALKRVDRFVVLSKFMQDELRKDRIEATYIPNFTKLFSYQPFDVRSRMILYAGRLEKVKGVEYLIDAMRDIVDVHPDATLVVAGEGSYRKILEARAKPFGQNILILGHKIRTELEQLYAKCAVVVMPSVWPEAFGKIGIEAMSVGRPVVATNVGGISEWMNSEVGFLVEPQSAQALAQPIIKLLSDDALREKMSKAAAEHAKQFSINNHLIRIIQIYENLLSQYI